MPRLRRSADNVTVPRAWRWLGACLLAVAGLAGCTHSGNDMLAIAPQSFPECQGPDIEVRVSWDATRVVKDGDVMLLVYKPGGEPRLWMQAAPKGEAKTGPWASDGWTVTLQDDHGKLLATRTLQTTACPAAAE